MLFLPGATKQLFDGGSGGSFTDGGEPKGCLHTTETSGWPGYRGGKSAPHATVEPIPRRGVDVRQHTPFDRAARALRNPAGGVQTNRDRVYQFELIGTCDKGGPGYYWPDADDVVLTALFHEVIAPTSSAFGIPLRALEFLAYPASYGPSRVRMSGARFDAYSGWLGHQHVPENTHGDPGAFPWARMLALGGASKPTHHPAPSKPPSKPAPSKPPVATPGERSRLVRWQRHLRVAADGVYGPTTAATDMRMRTACHDPHAEVNVRDVQRVLGVKPDGARGPLTNRALDVWTRAAQTLLGGLADGDWGATTDHAWWTQRWHFTHH